MDDLRIRTDKKTTFKVDDFETESHAEAERHIAQLRMKNLLEHYIKSETADTFFIGLDQLDDPEAFLLLLHDYVNPWRKGSEDDCVVTNKDEIDSVQTKKKKAEKVLEEAELDKDQADISVPKRKYRPTYEYEGVSRDYGGEDDTLKPQFRDDHDRGNCYYDTIWRYKLDFCGEGPSS